MYFFLDYLRQRQHHVVKGHKPVFWTILCNFGALVSNLALLLYIRPCFLQYRVPTPLNWLNRCGYANVTYRIGISTLNQPILPYIMVIQLSSGMSRNGGLMINYLIGYYYVYMLVSSPYYGSYSRNMDASVHYAEIVSSFEVNRSYR